MSLKNSNSPPLINSQENRQVQLAESHRSVTGLKTGVGLCDVTYMYVSKEYKGDTRDLE